MFRVRWAEQGAYSALATAEWCVAQIVEVEHCPSLESGVLFNSIVHATATRAANDTPTRVLESSLS
jgi:hypothetical protein